MKTYTDITIYNEKFAYRLAGSRYGLTMFLVKLNDNGELDFSMTEMKTTMPYMRKSDIPTGEIEATCETLRDMLLQAS